VRTFPDGSFDGYVRLAPGENRIEVVARMEDGREARAARTVVLVRPKEPSAEERAAAEMLLDALRVRTIETELGVRARQRAPQERELEVRVGDEE
jgi:hypothetical protein